MNGMATHLARGVVVVWVDRVMYARNFGDEPKGVVAAPKLTANKNNIDILSNSCNMHKVHFTCCRVIFVRSWLFFYLLPDITIRCVWCVCSCCFCCFLHINRSGLNIICVLFPSTNNLVTTTTQQYNTQY